MPPACSGWRRAASIDAECIPIATHPLATPRAFATARMCASMIAADTITLGILAGGRATRLGGIDKAWLERAGVDQATRWRDRFTGEVGHVLISTNRPPERYLHAGLTPIADRPENGHMGPIAGLGALADACCTRWLLTIPVDLVEVCDGLVPRLIAEAAPDGACAVDDDGLQPLVGLWRVAALRAAVDAAFGDGELAVQSLQQRMAMARVRFDGVRFGNLNTAADLAAAGFSSP